jgi:hypothetical protein
VKIREGRIILKACYTKCVGKKRAFLTFFFRLGLEILALEAAYLALSWLLHRYWNLLQRLSFVDVLFFMGILAATMGSAGMMRSPYGVPLSPSGVWASQVQSSEEEKHAQMVDELMHRTSFGLRLLVVGVITTLLSIAMIYIK